MDIQKEREAFESWWEAFHNGRQIACDYVEEDNSYSVGYANAQWVAWQAKAQVVPEWISVEDELPPTDTMVLICWSDSPEVEPEKDFMDICTDTGCPFWANYLNDMPTHWMPLPDAPQEPAND